jgi:hypothetical protein
LSGQPLHLRIRHRIENALALIVSQRGQELKHQCQLRRDQDGAIGFRMGRQAGRVFICSSPFLSSFCLFTLLSSLPHWQPVLSPTCTQSALSGALASSAATIEIPKPALLARLGIGTCISARQPRQ